MAGSQKKETLATTLYRPDPEQRLAWPVPQQDWGRLRRSIDGIRTQPSTGYFWTAFVFGIAISAALGRIACPDQPAEARPVLLAIAVAAGLATVLVWRIEARAAVGLGKAIDCILTDMDDVEENNAPPPEGGAEQPDAQVIPIELSGESARAAKGGSSGGA